MSVGKHHHRIMSKCLLYDFTIMRTTDNVYTVLILDDICSSLTSMY